MKLCYNCRHFRDRSIIPKEITLRDESKFECIQEYKMDFVTGINRPVSCYAKNADGKCKNYSEYKD